mgnify:CR=1 FL=1
MILGSLAIAIVLPQEKIGLVNGVMQAFTNFFEAYHLTGLMPVVVVLLLLGSLGSMVNWIISPAKGLLLAADNGFLPHWLYRLNRHGIASRILLLQAVLVTLLCSGFLLFSSVNAIYWLFTALSTELYIMMYVMMFIAAIRLKHKFSALPRPFAIPGGQAGYYFICLLGLSGCAITLLVGFFPPENSMDVGGADRFRMIFGGGIILMLIPAILLYLRKITLQKRPSSKTQARSPVSACDNGMILRLTLSLDPSTEIPVIASANRATCMLYDPVIDYYCRAPHVLTLLIADELVLNLLRY